jgi:hypothetical protein
VRAVWTETRVATLKLLAAQGLSGSQIAIKLGGFEAYPDKGRNAVIAKCDREHIVLGGGKRLNRKGGGGLSRAQRRAIKTKCSSKPIHNHQFGDNGKSEKPWKGFSAPETDHCSEIVSRETDPPPAARKHLVDLEPEHCRWPFGEAPITFCGRTRAEGLSYCPEHACRAVAAPEPPRAVQPAPLAPVREHVE